MKLIPIDDSNSDFESVEINKNSPHCVKHGAMNKVSSFEEGGGYWRCITAVAGDKSENTCRSGCIQTK